MAEVTHAIPLVASSIVFFGSKLGMLCLVAFPAVAALATIRGDRLVRVYQTAACATVGILIARMLAEFVHAASIG